MLSHLPPMHKVVVNVLVAKNIVGQLVRKTTIAISDMMKPDRIRRPDKSTLMH
jgi:hypothetical protein